MLFTGLHVFANYKAVKSVNIEVFNLTRLGHLCDNYFQTRTVLPVAEVNGKENVWFFLHSNLEGRLVMGVSLSTHFSTSNELQALQAIYLDAGYVLTCAFKDDQRTRVYIRVSLGEKSGTSTFLEAAVHALLIDQLISYRNTSKLSPQFVVMLKVLEDKRDYEFLKQTRDYVRQTFAAIVPQMRACGWDLSKHFLIIDDWRYTFDV